MDFPKKLYNDKQKDWCINYQHHTNFEPLMDDYEAGNCTFQEAASRSVHWVESWSCDALIYCDLNQMSLKD